jgi:predicted DNA-binding protein
MKEALHRNLVDEITLGEDAGLPVPDSDVPMVSRSLRLPLDLYQRVCAAANERGVGVTTLMRQFVEAGMADLDDGAVVAVADLRRAMASLARPAPSA